MLSLFLCASLLSYVIYIYVVISFMCGYESFDVFITWLYVIYLPSSTKYRVGFSTYDDIDASLYFREYFLYINSTFFLKVTATARLSNSPVIFDRYFNVISYVHIKELTQLTIWLEYTLTF